MSITTYTELQAAVASWMDRTDLTSVIPDFISLAETKLNRELRCIQMEKRSTASVNMSSSEPQYIALPDDFRMMRRLRLSSVTGKPVLAFRSPTQIADYNFSRADTTGQPLYFTVFGSEMELSPVPDSAYTLEMIYASNITPLSSTAPINWLLTQAPDAYLYGALMESEPYMKNDPRIGVWATGRQLAIDELNRQSQQQAYGASPIGISVSGATP